MRKFVIFVIISMMWSCVSLKNMTSTSRYTGGAVGLNTVVYGLPQTRLYFEVGLVKTIVRKGPYAEYASRMLGLQDVQKKDSELWHISSIGIRDKGEVDGEELYSVSFIDYPYNLDKMLRFSKEGLILDVSADNVLTGGISMSEKSEAIRFMNTAIKSTVVERVDTFYKTIHTDTAFVRIPVLQRKVQGKTTEEQARETAAQIFDIRQGRLDLIKANTDHTPDGAAMKVMLEALDAQEAQLLSLFTGVKAESRYTYTCTAVPTGAGSTPLLYFSEKTGVVKKGTAGAKEVWYKIDKAGRTSKGSANEAMNVVYYRIPQVVEVSAGIGDKTLTTRQKSIYQFGTLVSFPLLEPEK